MFEKEGRDSFCSEVLMNVPQVIGRGRSKGFDFLCMAYETSINPSTFFWQNFGSQIAKMYRIPNKTFGLSNGNFIVGVNNEPVIFDPVVFFGHREGELACTRLFGEFDIAFYEEYNE